MVQKGDKAEAMLVLLELLKAFTGASAFRDFARFKLKIKALLQLQKYGVLQEIEPGQPVLLVSWLPRGGKSIKAPGKTS